MNKRFDSMVFSRFSMSHVAVLLVLGGCGSSESAPSAGSPDASSDAVADAASDALLDAGSDATSDGEGGEGGEGGASACVPPCHAWARLLAGPSEEDEIDAVASDADGNVFVSGKFETELTIEGHDTPLVSAGRADIMLAKYSRDGDLIWVRHYGGVSEDNVFDAVCDDQGNVILSGYFGATVDFGGIVLETTGVDDLDMMVVKVDPSGEVIWAVRAGGDDVDGGNEINIAPDGTLVVLAGSGGDFRAGTIDFAGMGRQDAIVLTMEPQTGEFLWGGHVGGAGTARAKCLTVDAAGNVYAGGDYEGENSVFGPNRTDVLPTPQQLDAFLTSWTADGQLRWTKTWGGPGLDLCKGAVATDQGDLFFVGYFGPPTSFDGEVLEGDGSDIFLWKLNDQGEAVWLNHISSSKNLTGAEATSSPSGGVLFGHKMSADVTFGSTDGKDVVVKLPKAGTSWPVFVGYSSDGVVDFTLLPKRSTDANLDELSRSGSRVYIDVPILEGTCEFGEDVRSSTGTKDALLVAIDL